MKRLNKKGFTLIELLAVIVILALLIVVAAGRVTNALDNSKKSALKTEAQKILNSKLAEVESAYILKGSTSGLTSAEVEGLSGSKITGNDGTYTYSIALNGNLGVDSICVYDGSFKISQSFSGKTHSDTNIVITESVVKTTSTCS